MPSLSLILTLGTAVLLTLSPRISAQTYSYALEDTFAGSNFYDNFNFYDGADPTHGFVTYVNETFASTSGLTGFGTNTAKWGVDATNVISTTSSGRLSVRLESKNSYNHGLFLADIKHMPGSICGVWPAFWTLGDGTWPAHGELDIIEGVNTNSANQFTAHTASNCTMSFPDQTGPVLTTDCAVSTGGTAGCAVGSSKSNDYGTNFNSNGGGVYAMQWTSAFIKLWFFPRNAIPASITAGTPDVTQFGTPQADFDGASCSIDSHFVNHRLIFDTTFCGKSAYESCALFR